MQLYCRTARGWSTYRLCRACCRTLKRKMMQPMLPLIAAVLWDDINNKCCDWFEGE